MKSATYKSLNRPMDASYDLTDKHLANPKLVCNLLLGKAPSFILVYYFYAVRFFNFCHSVFRAMTTHHPALIPSVFGIGFLCSEKKMGWSHAAWVVALVTYTHSAGDFSVVELPRESVRPGKRGYPVSSCSGFPKASVSASIYGGNPEPAIIGLVDLLPKSVLYGSVFHI